MADSRKIVALFAARPAPLPGAYDYAVDVDRNDGRTVVSWWLPASETGDAFVTGLAPGTWVWEVDERAQWDDPARPPGVKVVSFLHRLPALTREQFGAHWSQRHAPLARRHHPAIVRYVQNVVITPLTPGTPEVDGIAELSYGSVDDMRQRQYDSPDGQRIITEDVARFLQLPSAFRLLADEAVLRAGNRDRAS